MTQKIIQVGKSAAVTLPRAFLKKVGWRIGSTIEVAADDASGEVHIRPVGKRSRRGLSPEFLAWSQDFVERYRPALEKLARR